VVDAEALRRFTAGVLTGMGAGPQTVDEVARHLVTANLCGHDSHGVLRLSQYIGEADRGELVPAAETELLRESAVCALFDAHRGFGHRSTMVAAEWAARHAHEHGLAAAAIRHSMHIGRLGQYTERLAGEGLVGLVTVGSAGPGGGTVAPFGGAARFLGTNPWSIGIPAAGRPPLVFDAATSTIAEGKARLARESGTEVPEGSVRGPDGRPTRDPAQLYAGGTLTVLGGEVAGHKGFGLSLASALLGGLAMIGDPDPTSAGTTRSFGPGRTRVAGVFLVAIDPAAFGEPLEYQHQVAGVLDAVSRAAPLPGVEHVQVAGDPERASRERRQREGIALPPATWDDLMAIGSRFGLSL
jgi:hydroxycarboxylate dehydrogenase B